jgi:hypothetical protein
MQNLNEYADSVFPLGFNDKFPPEELPKGYCVTAQNCFLEERKIIERTGYSLAGNDTNENSAILGLGYLEVGAIKHIIRVANDSSGTFGYIRYWAGSGDWVWISTATLTASVPVELETANGAAYLTNGTDSVYKWDGTTLSAVAAFPRAFFIKWFHNYMFAFKTTANKSRLYFSNLGDPDTWGASDFIDLEPNDGDEGTGMAVLGDELILAKNNVLKSFSGWTLDSFTVADVNEKLNNYGTPSHRSFVNIGNDLLFLSYAGDIPHFRSLKRTQFAENIYGGIISDDIEGTMNGLSKAELDKACGVYDGKRVRYFVPNASSTTNDLGLFYDVTSKGWTKHTGINASCALIAPVTGTPVIYFGEARSESLVYQFDSSNSDNGSSIDFQFETRRFLSDRFRKTKFKYLYVEAETIGNVDVNIFTSIDGFDYDSQGVINLQSTSSTFPITFDSRMGSNSLVRKRYELGYPPRFTIQLKFTKNDILARATIRDYVFRGYPRNLRDISM